MATETSPKDVAQRIITLRADVQQAQRLRAEAEGTLAVAKARLAEVDTALKKLGLDPEKADVELAALERQLDKTVTDLQAQITDEIGKYNEILTASRAVVT